jgi:hypothetical protein
VLPTFIGRHQLTVFPLPLISIFEGSMAEILKTSLFEKWTRWKAPFSEPILMRVIM